jgi:hypothetical protein
MRGTFSLFSDAVCFLGPATGLATTITKVEIWRRPLDLFRELQMRTAVPGMKVHRNVKPQQCEALDDQFAVYTAFQLDPASRLVHSPARFVPSSWLRGG